jgi:hypothetical protein
VISPEQAGTLHGLFLERVYYEGDKKLESLDPVMSIGSETRL